MLIIKNHFVFQMRILGCRSILVVVMERCRNVDAGLGLIVLVSIQPSEPLVRQGRVQKIAFFFGMGNGGNILGKCGLGSAAENQVLGFKEEQARKVVERRKGRVVTHFLYSPLNASESLSLGLLRLTSLTDKSHCRKEPDIDHVFGSKGKVQERLAMFDE